MRVENGGSANRIPEGMANYFSSAVRPPWIWFDRLMMAVARREIDMVAAWSADRLGRSLTDLLSFLTDLHAKGVDLFLHQQGLDASASCGRAGGDRDRARCPIRGFFLVHATRC
jgi:hypothetical protein